MKIAYINVIYSRSNMQSVEKKIIEEAKYFTRKGFDVYYLNRMRDGYEHNVYFKQMDKYCHRKFFELYLRAFTFDIIAKIVDLDAYDKIYLRYPLVDFSSFAFARRYGEKVVTQHHTKELEEILTFRFVWPLRMFQYGLERFAAPYFFRRIMGLTAISDDIVQYETKRLNFRGKTQRFSNGINPDQFVMRMPPPLEKDFNLIMVASSYLAWHGLDRILRSLETYQSDEVIVHLYLVGDVSDEYHGLIEQCASHDSVEVHVCGKRYGNALDDVFEKAHMACDSLAMYRLNMSESSTLKSKEYIARGIPFVYSAPDRDLTEIEACLFNAGNDDTLIDLKALVTFYRKLDIITMQKRMRHVVDTFLAWDKKIEHLKENMFSR